MTYDAIIIGGSYAGLSAGLQLARARKKLLVIDGGRRRNRFAATSHGFLGQDGRAPGDITADGRAQLLAYDTVEWIDGEVVTASGVAGSFALGLADGRSVAGRRLVLALGVADELPALPGLAERWGRFVFHCPYCHGYELQQGRIGVLATSPQSLHHALMLPDWGPTTLFLNEAFVPDGDQLAQLEKRGVTVEAVPVARVDGAAVDMHLVDGRVVPLDGLFLLPKLSVSSPLAAMLGCAFDESPFGAYIRTDMTKETTVPGVFACGDAARPFGSVALAVGDGAVAGGGTHQSLIFRTA